MKLHLIGQVIWDMEKKNSFDVFCDSFYPCVVYTNFVPIKRLLIHVISTITKISFSVFFFRGFETCLSGLIYMSINK